MANLKESEFGKKVKKVCSNRAVVVTFVTLAVALVVLVAVTVSANRAKLQNPNPLDTSLSTNAQTDQNVWNGNVTLPAYNSGGTDKDVGGEGNKTPVSFSLPVSAGSIAKDHDPTIQVYSATMGDYRVHLGLDIATADDAPVCAVAAGTVTKVWEDSLMGTCVAVTHADDTVSIYKNLSKTLTPGIEEKVSVKSGQMLGSVGDTAILELADEPHLHFEMTVGGLAVDPMDYFSAEDAAKLTGNTFNENGK